MRMAKTSNILFERSNTSKEYVQSESNGLSVAKVLNAISDDRSWSLFTAIAISSDRLKWARIRRWGSDPYFTHESNTQTVLPPY